MFQSFVVSAPPITPPAPPQEQPQPPTTPQAQTQPTTTPQAPPRPSGQGVNDESNLVSVRRTLFDSDPESDDETTADETSDDENSDSETDDEDDG